jgi:hypothetical protein
LFLRLVKQGKPLHHEVALRILEDCDHLLASRGSCLKFLGLTVHSADKQMARVFWDMVEWLTLFDKMKEQ